MIMSDQDGLMRRMTKRIVRLVVIIATLLMLSTSALARGLSDKVVPFKSMAGVSFGWTPAHVRRVLGQPVQTAKAGDEPGEYIYSVGGGDQNLSVFFEPNSPNDGVNEISIVSATFYTIKGIHSSLNGGSSRAAVKRVFGHYPHFGCYRGGYCTTIRGAANVAAKYGAVEMQFDFLEGKLIGFDMSKNLIG
jgi:hypothetical protein